MKKSIFLKVVVLSLFFVTLSSVKDCTPVPPTTNVYNGVTLYFTTQCLDPSPIPEYNYSSAHSINIDGGSYTTQQPSRKQDINLDWVCPRGGYNKIEYAYATLTLVAPNGVKIDDASKNFTVSIEGMNDEDEKFNNITVFRFDATQTTELEKDKDGNYTYTVASIPGSVNSLSFFKKLEARIYYY